MTGTISAMRPSSGDPVANVIGHFHDIVAVDHGALTLVSRADGVVRLRYLKGVNDECAECVLEADDLRELVLEAMQRQDASVQSLEIEVMQ